MPDVMLILSFDVGFEISTLRWRRERKDVYKLMPKSPACIIIQQQNPSKQRKQWSSMEYLDMISCFNLLVLIRLFIGTPSTDGFSFTVKDSYLASQVMKTVFFKDWLSCTLACQDDDKCASYNFNTFTGSCDLNEQGLQQPFSGPNELVKMQGMIFHQIRVGHAYSISLLYTSKV